MLRRLNREPVPMLQVTVRSSAVGYGVRRQTKCDAALASVPETDQQRSPSRRQVKTPSALPLCRRSPKWPRERQVNLSL